MENMESCVTMAWSPALSDLATKASVTQSKDAEKQNRAKAQADAAKNANNEKAQQGVSPAPNFGESKPLVGGSSILVQPKTKKGLY